MCAHRTPRTRDTRDMQHTQTLHNFGSSFPPVRSTRALRNFGSRFDPARKDKHAQHAVLKAEPRTALRTRHTRAHACMHAHVH
eukprot:13359568-Alexandrium_andersonii.AAC.1